jgi:hypothetical protein
MTPCHPLRSVGDQPDDRQMHRSIRRKDWCKRCSRAGQPPENPASFGAIKTSALVDDSRINSDSRLGTPIAMIIRCLKKVA